MYKKLMGFLLSPVNFPKNPIKWPYKVRGLMYGEGGRATAHFTKVLVSHDN